MVFLIVLFLVFVNSFLKPILTSRLRTLVVQGSDSLYTYTLDDIDPDFLGSSVAVQNLRLRIDSNRYRILQMRNALPLISFEMDLVKGSVHGVGLFALLFQKKLTLSAIKITDATITLLRHAQSATEEADPPLWKTIQPAIKSISIRRVDFDNLKLAYKNADTADAVRFRFEKCFADLDDFRIDSASAHDTARAFYAREVSLDFRKFNFVTADSVYRMQAGSIRYSSRKETLEVLDFMMKPMLVPDSFYLHKTFQVNMNDISFRKMAVRGFGLPQFLNRNELNATEVVINQPRFFIYLDKNFPPPPDSKIGNSPQQLLFRAGYRIAINRVRCTNTSLRYTEKNEKTKREGTVALDGLDLQITNITNDSLRIRRSPECIATATGKILGSSNLSAKFIFSLGNPEGRFRATGSIGPVQAAQLNPLSEPLAGVQLTTFNMPHLQFSMTGDQLTATTDVSMKYSNLSVVFQKTDEASGAVKTKKLITRILNRYTLYPANPLDGNERRAVGIERTRTSAQSFAALVWQGIFAGMQDIMMKKR